MHHVTGYFSNIGQQFVFVVQNVDEVATHHQELLHYQRELLERRLDQ